MSNEKEKHTPTPWQVDGAYVVVEIDHEVNHHTHGGEIACCARNGALTKDEMRANAAFIVEACNSHATLKEENERLRKIILTIRSAACSLEAELPGDEDNTVNADWIIEITEPAVTTTNTTQQ